MKVVAQLSSCVIATDIWKNQIELKLNSVQFSILSIFESKDSISLESLMDELKLTPSFAEHPLIVIYI